MIKGFKVRLSPTKEQVKMFGKCFGLNRYIYNYCVDKQSKNYEQGNKFINKYELKKETIKLKEVNEYTNEESFLDEETISQLNYKRFEDFSFLFYNTEEELREILTKNKYINIKIDKISYKKINGGF